MAPAPVTTFRRVYRESVVYYVAGGVISSASPLEVHQSTQRR